MNRLVVGTIKKNGYQDLQVAFQRYKTHLLIDVRVPSPKGDQMTPYGLTMLPERWREVLPIISRAIEELANPDSELVKELE